MFYGQLCGIQFPALITSFLDVDLNLASQSPDNYSLFGKQIWRSEPMLIISFGVDLEQSQSPINSYSLFGKGG